MSSFLNPVGPESPGTYWKRRAVLVGGVLVLVVGAGVVIAGPGEDRMAASGRRTIIPSAGAGPTPVASAVPSGVPSTTPGAGVAVTGTAPVGSAATTATSPAAVATTAPAAIPPCAPPALRLTAGADRSSYAANLKPVLSLTVRNTGATPCQVDVGAAAQELTVSSGSDRIWSSDDCGPRAGRELVTLDPGEARAATLPWGRLRSASGCPTGLAAARPGTYVVVARLGAQLSQGAAFRLLG